MVTAIREYAICGQKLCALCLSMSGVMVPLMYVGDPGLPGGVGPEGEPQDCIVQGVQGVPGQKGEPGEPGTDTDVTDGARFIEIQSEIERLKTDLTCCNGFEPARRRRQTQVIGAGGSDTSLSDDLVCR